MAWCSNQVHSFIQFNSIIYALTHSYIHSFIIPFLFCHLSRAMLQHSNASNVIVNLFVLIKASILRRTVL